MDRIVWINHAGFQLESAGIRLVCDPWLSGPSFDRGWSLLSPTLTTPADLSQATHIWFSHEHSDHFVPRDLRQVDNRDRITVLFQRTKDRRVARACEGMGFRVQELEPMKAIDLGGVRVTIDAAGIDSWLHVKTPQATYLNMNDFVPNKPRRWKNLKSAVGDRLDVLFTQFSYARWTGNRGDGATMTRQADSKRAAMRLQIEAFRPRFLVPSASFVYFSHEENFYLNAGANTIDGIAGEFSSVVLYPGDTWDLQPRDNQAALARYGADMRARRPQFQNRPVSWELLCSAAGACAARLAINGRLATGLLGAPLVVRFTDLGFTARYCAGTLERSAAPSDIACSADAFLICLEQDFGSDTLMVNGRFQEERPGGHLRLSRAFALNRYNARGTVGLLPILCERARLML